MGAKGIEIPGLCENTDCSGPIDIRTLCCARCGVSHSEPCPSCGRFGFHRDDCAEMEPPHEGPMEFREVCSDCQLVLKPGTPGAELSHSICRMCWPKYCPDLPYPEASDEQR